MKEDVGMSKPKKHANKVMWDPKLNKPLTYTTIKQNTKSCTYVGLYGSGLFNFGSHITLFACFLGFDIPTSFIFIGNVFLLFLFPLYFFSEWCEYFFCRLQKCWCKLYII